jgi:hypothetical protein
MAILPYRGPGTLHRPTHIQIHIYVYGNLRALHARSPEDLAPFLATRFPNVAAIILVNRLTGFAPRLDTGCQPSASCSIGGRLAGTRSPQRCRCSRHHQRRAPRNTSSTGHHSGIHRPEFPREGAADTDDGAVGTLAAVASCRVRELVRCTTRAIFPSQSLTTKRCISLYLN